MSIKKFFTYLGWPLLAIPAFMLWTGLACNTAATALNHQMMPVMNPICIGHEGTSMDHIHVCVGPETRAKLLIDRFPANDSVLSLGDILQAESDAAQKPCFLLWLANLVFLFFGRRRN